MTLPVTYLFVPGNRPERFDKAMAAGADMVILDLEDAVSPDDKESARESVARWIDTRMDQREKERIAVRMNDASTAWFRADLRMLMATHVRYAMLPKVERKEQVDEVCSSLDRGSQILPLIETALGIDQVDTIATSRGVQRMAFGTLDYGVDLDLSGDERGLMYPSARIASASRLAGLASPIAGVTPAIDDEPRLLADLAFARAFGFGAKLCIHPKQVAIIAKALLPSPAEIDWARRVLAASESTQGAVQVDGRMVDRPVLLRAQTILDRAGV
jgi:citrate lyase subunit beta/citryl-CoA lyase